jgi:hypothetical protein
MTDTNGTTNGKTAGKNEKAGHCPNGKAGLCRPDKGVGGTPQ